MDLKKNRFPLSWLVYLVLFGVIAAISAIWSMTFLIKQGGEVVVPSLTGKTIREATYLLEQKGLQSEILGVRFNQDIPVDSVVYQTIPVGEKVRSGRLVGLFLSQGPREHVVPRVVGLEREAAGTILGASGLRGLEVATACSNQVQRDQVIAQDPRPGSSSPDGTVNLLISLGSCSNRFVIGEMVARPVEEVIDAFDQHGFHAHTLLYEERGMVPSGTIAESRPGAGAIVRPLDPITLVVSAATGFSAPTRPESQDQIFYFSIEAPPGLLRRQARIVVQRPTEIGSSTEKMLLNPGEKVMRAVWLFPGSQVTLELDGKEIWRKAW